jgi:elongation factor P--(R)-beta-lysine ligase
MATHSQSAMTPAVARVRAGCLRRIRAFFEQRGVLEVQTPVLSRGACPDRHIDLFTASQSAGKGRTLWMQSSPELHMKRLLAAGYPDIYQVCPVFRQEESGRRHNPEFTILEWYRRGLGAQQLMEEVSSLCVDVAGSRTVQFRPYAGLVREHTGIDPLSVTHAEVSAYVAAHEQSPPQLPTLTDALQYLMARHVEPRLPHDTLTFVHSYPAAQAVLAALDPSDSRVAQRFELYCGCMELANGWQELADPAENLARMAEENAARGRMGKPQVPVQPGFAEALGAGLPACSGVALGVDRLVMLAAGVKSIDEVLAFGWETA